MNTQQYLKDYIESLRESEFEEDKLHFSDLNHLCVSKVFQRVNGYDASPPTEEQLRIYERGRVWEDKLREIITRGLRLEAEESDEKRKYIKQEKEAGVRGIYVNCWKRTFYSILDDILNELRVLGSERRETGFKLEKLRKALDGKPFIIALDEVDQISNKERNAMLYNLNFDKVGIICIGYNRKVLTFMDERVKSRLNPQQVEFPRYRVDDLANILERRAKLALVPDSWGRETLLKVAKLAEGDARVAIQTLRNAARLAENNGDDAISIKHIQKGFSSTHGLKKHYQLRSLSEHHKVLHQIVKERGKVKSGELQEEYRKECKKRELDPMAERTVDKYIKELIEHRFIKKERAKVRGRVYNYQVAE